MMKKAYRAIGQIEGVAFVQSELLRDLLMGAVDEIEEAMKAQEAKVAALDKTATEQTELVGRLMKQKDELLTENARLRKTTEAMAVEIRELWEQAQSPDDVQEFERTNGKCPYTAETLKRIEKMLPSTKDRKVEIATSALEGPPRNNKSGVREKESDGGQGSGRPTEEEQEKSCPACRGDVDLFGWANIRIRVVGDRLTVKTPNWESASTIAFCPKCRRKL